MQKIQHFCKNLKGSMRKGSMQTSPFWYLLLSLTLAFSSPSVLAQQTNKLTIEELQRLGLQANGLVLAARSQIDMAKAGVVAASAFLNPEVTVMAGPDSNRHP